MTVATSFSSNLSYVWRDLLPLTSAPDTQTQQTWLVDDENGRTVVEGKEDCCHEGKRKIFFIDKGWPTTRQLWQLFLRGGRVVPRPHTRLDSVSLKERDLSLCVWPTVFLTFYWPRVSRVNTGDFSDKDEGPRGLNRLKDGKEPTDRKILSDTR